MSNEICAPIIVVILIGFLIVSMYKVYAIRLISITLVSLENRLSNVEGRLNEELSQRQLEACGLNKK